MSYNEEAERSSVEQGVTVEEGRKVVDLNGMYHFKVDAKGRVSLPAKFRKALSDDLVVAADIEEEFLMVFEQQAYNDWVEGLFRDRFGGYRPSVRQHIRLRSLLKSRSCDVQPDSAGRILLPADQRKLVHIERDVVIVGNTGYFEIWDAKRHSKLSEEVSLTDLLINL